MSRPRARPVGGVNGQYRHNGTFEKLGHSAHFISHIVNTAPLRQNQRRQRIDQQANGDVLPEITRPNPVKARNGFFIGQEI